MVEYNVDSMIFERFRLLMFDVKTKVDDEHEEFVRKQDVTKIDAIDRSIIDLIQWHFLRFHRESLANGNHSEVIERR